MDGAQLIAGMTDAFARRDADAMAELLHPEVCLELATEPAPIRGREAARRWYREAFRGRSVFAATSVAEERPDGSMLLSGRVQYWGAGGGRDQPQQWVVEFRDGLVSAVRAVPES